MNYIKIKWSNSCDLGGIYYQGGYENVLFLESTLAKPEYFHEEEGYENGHKEFIKTSETLIKRYKFEVVVPEYLSDALKFMALHDTITIQYSNGLYSSSVRNVQVNSNSMDESNDCMFLVEVSFEQNDQIVKNSCCNNLI